jgi:hypothetical protein
VSLLRHYRWWLWTAGIVVIISIIIGYRYDITLWDWIKLLIVPAVIGGARVRVPSVTLSQVGAQRLSAFRKC